MSNHRDTYDIKAVNFLKFLNELIERYQIPEFVLSSMHMRPDDLLNNKAKRKEVFEQHLPMICTSSPETARAILTVRDFFEGGLSPDDRLKFVEETMLAKMREHADRVNKAIQFVDENKEQVAQDLYRLGGYLTLFTENQIKRGPKKQQ